MAEREVVRAEGRFEKSAKIGQGTATPFPADSWHFVGGDSGLVSNGELQDCLCSTCASELQTRMLPEAAVNASQSVASWLFFFFFFSWK